jgi:prolyl-tRNA synthetase
MLKLRIAGSVRVATALDASLPACVLSLLTSMQEQLFRNAADRLAARTVWIERYEDMKQALEQPAADGPAFFLAPWAPNDANELAVKLDCKATLRCYPDAEQARLTPTSHCFYDGSAAATCVALFARAF